MSRPTYIVKNAYTGTGSLAAYSFDFKIEELIQLLVVKVNTSGEEVARVRGTDVATLISSVTFNSVNGGGTVNLLSNLEAGYKLYIILASDAPTQPFVFKDKAKFSLRMFENALDYLSGQIQRLAFRASHTYREKYRCQQ